jgi:hypothetical protein
LRSAILVSFTCLLVLSVAAPLRADTTPIGQLNLGYGGWTPDNTHYVGSPGDQVLWFFNNTGGASGCAAQYRVCDSVDITDWTLRLTFLNNNPNNTSGTPASYGFFQSPFSYSGGSDVVDTIHSSDGILPYYGGNSGTWFLPLNLQGSDDVSCAAPTPCDYQITQVEFSGTISSTSLHLYNGGNPYLNFTADSHFDEVWNIPPDAYSFLDDAGTFFPVSSTDVLVTGQTQPNSSVPEPSSLLLCGIGLGILSCWKRSRPLP